LTAHEISNQLDIPIRFVNEILFELIKSNILSTAEIEEKGERGYQPARDINVLTIQYVIDAMEKRGLNSMPFTHAPEFVVSPCLLPWKHSVKQLKNCLKTS